MPNHGLGSLTMVWVSETMVRVRETVVLDLDVLPSGEVMLKQEYEFNLLVLKESHVFLFLALVFFLFLYLIIFCSTPQPN